MGGDQPADDVLGVAVLDAGDPVEPPVVPGVGLSLHGLHQVLAEPVDRTEDYRVHGSERHQIREVRRRRPDIYFSTLQTLQVWDDHYR